MRLEILILLVGTLATLVCWAQCNDESDAIIDSLSDLSPEGELANEPASDDENSSDELDTDAEMEPEEELEVKPSVEKVKSKWSEKNKFRFQSILVGQYYEEMYTKINDRLVSQVDNQQPLDNLDHVFEWLDKETSYGKEPDGNRLNRNLVLALKQLASLRLVLDQDRAQACSKEAWAALYKNDQATLRHTHKNPTLLMPLTRLESVVHQLGMIHAIKCLPWYPERFEATKGKLDQELYQRLLTYSPIMADSHLSDESDKKTVKKLLELHGRRPYSEARALVEIMNPAKHPEAALTAMHLIADRTPGVESKPLNMVVDERSAKLKVDEPAVKKLVDELLLEPCDHYVELMGPEVVQPMRYDIRMLDKEDFESLRRTLSLEGDYNLGLARYVHCKRLRHNAGKLKRNVIAAIRRQSWVQ